MMGVSGGQGTHKGHPYGGGGTAPRPAGWIPVSEHGNGGLRWVGVMGVSGGQGIHKGHPYGGGESGVGPTMRSRDRVRISTCYNPPTLAPIITPI